MPSRIRVRVRRRIALHSDQEKQKRKLGNAWITTRTELLTMATHALPFRHIPADDAAPSRQPLLRRLYIAILVAQMRRAQRQIDGKLGCAAPRR